MLRQPDKMGGQIAQGQARSDPPHTHTPPPGGEGEPRSGGLGKEIRVEGGVLAWSHPGRKGESELPLPKSACWGRSAAFARGRDVC